MTNPPEIKACPFCGGHGISIHENHHSPTMSGGIKDPISVDISHHCLGEGLPRCRINITGRTRIEAINKWNTRADLTPKWQGIIQAWDAIEGATTTTLEPSPCVEVRADRFLKMRLLINELRLPPPPAEKEIEG